VKDETTKPVQKKNMRLRGEELRHNPDRLLPSGKKAKHVIDSYQTIDNIEIYYQVGDDCRKIFSYTLEEGSKKYMKIYDLYIFS